MGLFLKHLLQARTKQGSSVHTLEKQLLNQVLKAQLPCCDCWLQHSHGLPIQHLNKVKLYVSIWGLLIPFLFLTLFLFIVCLSNHGSQSHPLSIPQKKTKQTLREKGVCGGGRKSLIMKTSVRHTESLSKLLYHRFFHAGVWCKESLVWFKDPGLCCTVMLALSGSLPGYCVAPLCHWEPAALGPQNRPHLQSQSLLQHMTDVFDVGSRPG